MSPGVGLLVVAWYVMNVLGCLAVHESAAVACPRAIGGVSPVEEGLVLDGVDGVALLWLNFDGAGNN